MQIGQILKDALEYPLSNWKNFLILGILFLVANLYQYVGILTQNSGLIIILVIIGLVSILMAYGYIFRIIMSSLTGENELPEFNKWGIMLIDGIKVSIVAFAYFVPVILIIILERLFGSFLILELILILYVLLILPVFFVAIANMAYHENKSSLSSPFKFREILDKISFIGWGNLIKWYILTGILAITLYVIMAVITLLLDLIYPILGGIVLSLLLYPYLDIFIARSVALFYISGND